MSLVSTLAKVAVGVALAKGTSQFAKAASQPNTNAGGGLGDMLGSLLGGNQSGGGLQGMFGQLTGGGQSGGLGGMLGKLTGGQSDSRSGGIGDMLGGLLGGAAAGGAAAGGLGGLFASALSGDAAEPTEEQEKTAALMLQAMAQAAICDGALDKAEEAKLMETLADSTEEERQFVISLLDQPVDADNLAHQTPRGMESQVYAMSLLAINLDSQAEANYLHQLAQALRLDPSEVDTLHDQANAPRLG